MYKERRFTDVSVEREALGTSLVHVVERCVTSRNSEAVAAHLHEVVVAP